MTVGNVGNENGIAITGGTFPNGIKLGGNINGKRLSFDDCLPKGYYLFDNVQSAFNPNMLWQADGYVVVKKQSADLKDAVVTLDKYTTAAEDDFPEVTAIKYGGKTFTQGEDFTVAYKRIVDELWAVEITATEAAEEDAICTGSKTVYYVVGERLSIEDAEINLTEPDGLYYNGQAHKPGVIVTYQGLVLTENEDYTVSYTNNINVGAGDIEVAGINAFCDFTHESFTILPAAITDLAAQPKNTLIYDGTQQTVEFTASATTVNDQDVTFAYRLGNGRDDWADTVTLPAAKAGDYSVEVKATAPNHATVSSWFTVTVQARPIAIAWSDTQLVYNGQPQKPTATMTNLVEGDSCTLTVTGEQTDANTAAQPGYVAKVTGVDNPNYCLPENAETTFVIKNAPQSKPTDLVVVDETIAGKKDGIIRSQEEGLEISTDGETYKPYTQDQGLSAGTYYVRRAAKPNYDASEPTVVTVKPGRMLKDELPSEEQQVGDNPANTPTNAPVTGQNSSLLWLALVIVSGGCLCGVHLMLNDRKKRAAAKR